MVRANVAILVAKAVNEIDCVIVRYNAVAPLGALNENRIFSAGFLLNVSVV
jgi:hypothetical protein